MSGGRPVPTNAGRGLVDRIVALQWKLHHRVSRSRAKMGEMIAFRADVPLLAPDTAVDEAYLEWLVLARHERVAYVPDAVVFNHGPTRAGELLEQRRRIWNGHLRLQRATGHATSTMSPRRLTDAALAHLRERPRDLPLLGAAMSAGPSASEQTTGQPAAIASRRTSPNGSYTEGKTKPSAARYSAWTAAAARRPRST